MSIKLLALDLDGTIFADDMIISERTRRAIRSAQDKGVVVTLATGRMFRSARLIADDLDIHELLICYQGALIAQEASPQVLYHRTVPLDLAMRIIADAGSKDLHVNLYLNDNIYVSRITPEAEFYSQINMGVPLNGVGDLQEWLPTQGGSEPTKLVIVTSAEQTDRTLAEFTRLFSRYLQVTKSHPRFTEFTNKGCSKGVALAFLAEHLGIMREEVMAIGDGHNDKDMVEWAGYGVAMANSHPDVLEVARLVTGSLTDDGAAQAIEQYVNSR